MAPSRTNNLLDEVFAAELVSLYNSLVISVDDPSYSLIDTKKIKISTLLSLVNTLISDLEVRVADNEDDILVNIADIQALQTIVDDLNEEIPWTTGTNVWGALQGSTMIRACKVGKIVYITGLIKVDYAPSVNTVLFTLPSNFPLFTETFYFNSGDGNVHENGELKCLSGTRNIVAGGGIGADSEQYYGTPIPVI